MVIPVFLACHTFAEAWDALEPNPQPRAVTPVLVPQESLKELKAIMCSGMACLQHGLIFFCQPCDLQAHTWSQGQVTARIPGPGSGPG